MVTRFKTLVTASVTYTKPLCCTYNIYLVLKPMEVSFFIGTVYNYHVAFFIPTKIHNGILKTILTLPSSRNTKG